jgi:hypothetical protein
MQKYVVRSWYYSIGSEKLPLAASEARDGLIDLDQRSTTGSPPLGFALDGWLR